MAYIPQYTSSIIAAQHQRDAQERQIHDPILHSEVVGIPTGQTLPITDWPVSNWEARFTFADRLEVFSHRTGWTITRNH